MDWKGNRTNSSELARVLIHESLHKFDRMGMDSAVNDNHRALDAEARRRLVGWGLGGGGCSSVGDHWLFGPTYPGC